MSPTNSAPDVADLVRRLRDLRDGDAYYRVAFEQIVKIGIAEWDHATA